MSLAKKLNLKEGMRPRVVGMPDGVELGDVPIASTESAGAQGILVFARTLADVEAASGPAVEAAREDRLAWIAYPKAGQLGTDLNRDVLHRHLQARGVQGVRQVAIDDVWSAMRFRPRA
jgi:hypothetical protein